MAGVPLLVCLPDLFTARTAACTAGMARRGRLLAALGHVLLAAALEVGFIPATALETKAGRRDQLLEGGLTARRTV